MPFLLGLSLHTVKKTIIDTMFMLGNGIVGCKLSKI